MTHQTPAPPRKPRRRYLRWAIDIAIVLAVIYAVGAWQTRDIPTSTLPDFHAATVDGNTSSLEQWRSQHPDSAVAVYFWAEWCGICGAMEGNIDRLAQNWPVLSVAMQSGAPEAVATQMEDKGVDWHTLVDEHGQLASHLGVHGVPTVIIVDAKGNTRFTEMGYTTTAGLLARIWWANNVSARNGSGDQG